MKKTRIKRWHKVPHITLVYNFRLKRNVKEWDIAKIIQNVASKYSVVKFHYNGFEVKKGNKGYVLAFKIKPSYELKKLRKEIYDTLKPFIEERLDVMNFNNVNENEFWFHATIGYRLSEKECNFLRNTMQSFKYAYFPAFAFRISLLNKGKNSI